MTVSGHERARVLEVRDVPRERRLLPRETAVFVLLGRLLADVRQIGSDRAAASVHDVARAAALLRDQFLAEVDGVGALRLAVETVADVAVHLHRRVLVVHEGIGFSERLPQERLLPVLDRAVSLRRVHGIALSAVARRAAVLLDGMGLNGAGECVRSGSSSVSKPFQRAAWWQVMQRSARLRSATQICWRPGRSCFAFSLRASR